jgi:hypothetical protein
MLNFCGIVVAILKMATGRNFSMSGINWDIIFSLLRQTSSYFYRCEIFLCCTSARQKSHVRFTGKCMLYSWMSTAPQFSMLFLLKLFLNSFMYYILLANVHLSQCLILFSGSLPVNVCLL